MSNYKWTPEEKQFIINNAEKMNDEQISIELNKICARSGSSKIFTKRSVKETRQRLGIKKKTGRGVCEIDIDHLNL